MAYLGFENILYYLGNDRVGQAMIPFFLIFAVIFAVLQKTKIFEKKQINVVIALSMALASIIPHFTGTYYYGVQINVVEILMNSLPSVGLIAIAIVMVFILLGVWRGPYDISRTNYISSFAVFFSFVSVVVIFLASAGVFGHNWRWPYWLNPLNDPYTRSFLLTVLVFGLAFYFLIKDPPSNNEGNNNDAKKFMKAILDDGKKGWGGK